MSNDARYLHPEHVSSRSSPKARTQSKAVQTTKTRNFGTMCESIPKRNFSNQVELDEAPTRDSPFNVREQQPEPGHDYPGPSTPQNSRYPVVREDPSNQPINSRHRTTSSSGQNQYPANNQEDVNRDRSRGSSRLVSPTKPHRGYSESRPGPSESPDHHRQTGHTPPVSRDRPEDRRSRTRSKDPIDHRDRDDPCPNQYRPRTPLNGHRSPSRPKDNIDPRNRRSRTSPHGVSSPRHQLPYEPPLSPPRARPANGHNLGYKPGRSPSPQPVHVEKRKDQPAKVAVETDTSLDGVKISVNIGVQPEPKSTRDNATSPTLHLERQSQPRPTIIRPANVTPPEHRRPTVSRTEGTRQNPDRFTPIYRDNVPLRDTDSPSTRRSFLLRPGRGDDHRSIPSRTSSMHDISTKNHDPQGQQYTRKPYKDDDYVSIISPPEESYYERRPKGSASEIRHGSYSEKLRPHESISIVPATVNQPDTLPRPHRHQTPTRDTSSGFPQQVSGTTQDPRQQDPFNRRSPKLHRADENILGTSGSNETTTPFENRYINQPNRDFASASHSSPSGAKTFLLPVLNSSRTYVFERNALPAGQALQSTSNGNFYLASPPAGSSSGSAFFPPERNIH